MRLMKLFRWVLVISFFLSSNPVVLAASDSNDKANGTTTSGAPNIPFVIAGQVKSASGAPLPGVMVKAALNTGNVIVLDEGGNSVSGAQVFDQTNLLGVTNAQGVLVAPNLQQGARLAARLKIAETTTQKYAHDQNSTKNWAYRTYITSLDIPQSGDPQGLLVANPNMTQTLTIKKTNTLIGFNLLVSVEWDAETSYLNDLKLAFQNASAYLYDASDGQMLFEQVNLSDDNVNAADADFFFQANNQIWPRAANATLTLANGKVELGKYFNRYSADSGSWSGADGYRTLVYLFSQYAFGLFDQGFAYDGNQNRIEASCTSSQITSNISDTVNASLLYWRYNASEFAMQNVAGLWSPACQSTLQFQKLALSDWETIRNQFQDTAPIRWQFLTPQERGGVVAGPQAAAMPSWMTVYISDANTNLCAAPVKYQVLDELGNPVAGAEVLLIKVNNRGAISQGKTNSLGEIEILGAVNTDQVVVNSWQGKFRSGSIIVSCFTQQPANPAALPAVTIQPHSFDLTSAVLPGATAQDVTVVITTSVPLTMPITLIFSQAGDINAVSINPPQGSASNVWETTLSLSPLLASAGVVYIQATNFNDTLENIRNFHFEQVLPGAEKIVHSQDGLLELTLPANLAANNGRVLVHSNQVVITTTHALTLLSGPYTIQTADGYSLPTSANLAISYQDPGGLLTGLDRKKIFVARWNGQAWAILNNSQASKTEQTISAVITQPGVYGVVVKPFTHLFLPMLTRLSATATFDHGFTAAELKPLPYTPVDLSGIQSSIVYSMATNASGYFTFTNIPVGEYLITPVQPGFTFSPLSRVAPPVGALNQDFTRQTDSPRQGETVFVAGGTFLMGCDAAHAGGATCLNDTKPLHTLFLSPFFLSKYEVDNGKYANCVANAGCTVPAETTYYGQPQYTNYPVIKVTWKQAGEYCAWAGGSLPTEAQWEKSARGPTPRSFPWGDTAPTCSLANYQNCLGHISPITATLGASPYGAMDLAGNVAEWVKDVYDAQYYASSPMYNPTGPAVVGTGQAHVIRGGSYNNSTASLVTAYRAKSAVNFPNLTFLDIGFRCQFPLP